MFFSEFQSNVPSVEQYTAVHCRLRVAAPKVTVNGLFVHPNYGYRGVSVFGYIEFKAVGVMMKNVGSWTVDSMREIM